MARRIQRKELKQDEFVEAAVDASHWLEDNWKLVAGWAAVAVVLTIAISGWVTWSGHKRDQAREILARGIASFQQAEEGDFDAALLGESIELLDEAVERGGSIPATKVARFYKGSALFHLDRRDEAISELEALAAEDLPQTLEPTARQMLARLYADAGRPDEAVTILEELADAEQPLVPVAETLMQLAEIEAEAGNSDAARAAWQRIVDEFADTAAAGVAQQRLAD